VKPARELKAGCLLGMRRVMIDAGKCNGCMTCVLACAGAHAANDKSIIGGMMEKTPPRIQVLPVKGRAVPLLCLHCEEPACVDACMTGAMRKDPKSGLVSNEGGEQACVGCWMCIMACPYGAVRQHPDKKVALKCDGCPDREVPACAAACPMDALIWGEVDDFAAGRAMKTALALLEGA